MYIVHCLQLNGLAISGATHYSAQNIIITDWREKEDFFPRYSSTLKRWSSEYLLYIYVQCTFLNAHKWMSNFCAFYVNCTTRRRQFEKCSFWREKTSAWWEIIRTELHERIIESRNICQKLALEDIHIWASSRFHSLLSLYLCQGVI